MDEPTMKTGNFSISSCLVSQYGERGMYEIVPLSLRTTISNVMGDSPDDRG